MANAGLSLVASQGDPSALTDILKREFVEARAAWDKENSLLYHLITALTDFSGDYAEVDQAVIARDYVATGMFNGRGLMEYVLKLADTTTSEQQDQIRAQYAALGDAYTKDSKHLSHEHMMHAFKTQCLRPLPIGRDRATTCERANRPMRGKRVQATQSHTNVGGGN